MKYHAALLMAVVSLTSPLVCARYWDDSAELKPCPTLVPDTSLSMEKLTGRWQLSLVVLDAANEDLIENDACINGEVTLLNDTYMEQVWEMFTPYVENEPTATFELITHVVKPGIWSVHTPLGGTLSATVFNSSSNHILVTHCGWNRGSQVHLWTAGVTRGRLQPQDRVKLSKALTHAGFHPTETKIITWSHC